MNALVLPTLEQTRCPICGNANECSAALSGSFSSRCWCASMTFTAKALALVPESQRNSICICKACATKEQQ